MTQEVAGTENEDSAAITWVGVQTERWGNPEKGNPSRAGADGRRFCSARDRTGNYPETPRLTGRVDLLWENKRSQRKYHSSHISFHLHLLFFLCSFSSFFNSKNFYFCLLLKPAEVNKGTAIVRDSSHWANLKTTELFFQPLKSEQLTNFHTVLISTLAFVPGNYQKSGKLDFIQLKTNASELLQERKSNAVLQKCSLYIRSVEYLNLSNNLFKKIE